MSGVLGSQIVDVHWEVKTDTFFSHLVNKSNTSKFIKETITIKDYDKDTGNLAKETKAEREFTQDSQTDIEQKEQGRVIEFVNDSTKVTENVITEAKMKEDSVIESGAVSFWCQFGKWIGIVVGCVIGLLVVYLLKQNRVN